MTSKKRYIRIKRCCSQIYFYPRKTEGNEARQAEEINPTDKDEGMTMVGVEFATTRVQEEEMLSMVDRLNMASEQEQEMLALVTEFSTDLRHNSFETATAQITQCMGEVGRNL